MFLDNLTLHEDHNGIEKHQSLKDDDSHNVVKSLN